LVRDRGIAEPDLSTARPALGPMHGSNIRLVVADRFSPPIDTGVGAAPLRPVVNAISENPIICLLTHGHYDHIGGAHEFADRRSHRSEAAILVDPNPRSTRWRGWSTRESFSRVPAEDFDFASYSIKPAPPTSLVDDGDLIELGGRGVTVMHAPGHSPGLISILETETGALFTSDALYHGRTFFDLEGSDRVHAARGIGRLRASGAQTVRPGHFQSLSGIEFHGLAAKTLVQMEVGH
jgi:glyoxylase-like metal-dependent hydrolase (beta-lactamase superfamily II)